MTNLLENLCYISLQKGGTIHQFLDTKHENFETLNQKLYYDFYQFNGMVSFDTINHYAQKLHIVIQWPQKVLYFYNNRHK